MRDVLEVSYTGDLLAHRRCPRAWAYEKYAGFHPYEQAQAMEGRLVHHGMEWLTNHFRQTQSHANAQQLQDQLLYYFKVLWARGVKTAFASKTETVTRVRENLFPGGNMHPTVRAAIEGATHSEYEIRTVRKLIREDFAGKEKLLLTGILDLVVQLEHPLRYQTTWAWSDEESLTGEAATTATQAAIGDVEIWDYKGSRSSTPFLSAFVLQLLTYAGLYAEHAGQLPSRCVIFFVNEPDPTRQLLAIPISREIVAKAEQWTISQAKRLRQTMLTFEGNPLAVSGGHLEQHNLPLADRIDGELAQQCTACGVRFDCLAYQAKLADPNHNDLSLINTRKN